MSIRLSDDEIWAALERAHTGILTSMKADGTPISLPLWFVALDGRIYFGGPTRRKKTARLRNNSRCCFLVESGTYWRELTGILLTGHAREVTDADLERRVRERLDAKYQPYRSPRASMPEETRSVYEHPDHVLFEIVPDERILSWDNSRIELS